MDWLDEFFEPTDHPKILEIGAPTLFTETLRAKYKPCNIENTIFDVRIPGWSFEDNSMDLVLCMEVLEHLGDIDIPRKDGVPEWDFLRNGMKTCLKECHRILKPGGALFVTTPNLNSLSCLASLAYMGPVYTWGAHVYEMGFNTAVDLVREPDFRIIHAATEEPYLDQKDWLEKQRRADAHTMLVSINAPLTNRGETTFIIGRK